MYVLCEIIITVTVVGIIKAIIIIDKFTLGITEKNNILLLCFNLPSQHKCLARDLRLAKVDCYSSL